MGLMSDIQVDRGPMYFGFWISHSDNIRKPCQVGGLIVKIIVLIVFIELICFLTNKYNKHASKN
jgi:hypothetical protein